MKSRPGHARSENGISLLEATVVLLVASTLLAVAAPRYQDAQRYSRIALINRLNMTMVSASDMFHLHCLLQQTHTSPADCSQLQVGLETVRGEAEFPMAGLDGIGRLVGLAPGDPAAAMFFTEPVTHNGHLALKVGVKAAEKGSCELEYRAPSVPGSRPQVVILASTCT